MDKVTIDIKDLEYEFAMSESESMTKFISKGVIFGKDYQVQVIITTNESDFIDPNS